MNPDFIPTIQNVILSVLDANGGSYYGTKRLAEIIPAHPKSVGVALHACRKTGLVRSLHTHGGRGHLALHRLTRQGRYVLTQKGKDHVKQSK